MTSLDCPFRKADELLAALDPGITVRFVDFHAELDQRKDGDGLASRRPRKRCRRHAHSHSDSRLANLPAGTAYQTDAGMTGPYRSVIGVDKDMVLRRFLTGLGGRMEAAKEGAELHGVLIAVDEVTGKARTIDRVCAYR